MCNHGNLLIKFIANQTESQEEEQFRMKTQQSSRRLMVVVLSIMMAVLLTGCGDNITATPIAISNIAAATTNSGTLGPISTTASNPGLMPTTIISKVDFKESDLPVYPRANRVEAMSRPQTEILSVTYITADDITAVASWATDAFLNKGWNDLRTSTSTNFALVMGKNGKYNLHLSITGGEVANTVRKFIPEAKPNDTVITVTIDIGSNNLSASATVRPVTTKAVVTTEIPIATEASVSTTASAHAASAIIAAYPNAKLLEVAQTTQQAFSDSSGALGIKNAKYQIFVVAENPTKVAAFYDADWHKQGFQQKSIVKTGSFDVTTLREVYYNDSNQVAIVAVGPMDASYLKHIATDTAGLKDMLDKVKVGDTLFVIVSGSE